MNRPRALVTLLLVLLALAIAVLAGWRIAAHRLEAVLAAALGPRASVGAVSLGWSGLQVDDLRIRAAPGAWPAADELRAARVTLSPSLASLWSGRWELRRVEIDAAYVSILRTRDGRLRLLPALLERQGGGSADEPVAVRLGQVELRDAGIDFFDASVRQPAHQLRLEALQAGLGPIDWPALDSATQVALQARLKGPHRDGRLAIDGTLTGATREARLKAGVHGVDLVALQPYLLKVNEGGVRRGTLDLALDATVKGQHLHAPGKLTLAGLELAGGGVLATFAGVPRQAVLAAMERDGRIEFAFTLDGRLDDPAFSINDNLATRIAGGLAEALGVSLGGVVEGVAGMVKGLFGR